MRRTFIGFLLALSVGSSLRAQLTVSIVTKSPMPAELSTWENDPTALMVFVTNTTATSYNNLRVSFTVTDLEKGQVVASTVDDHPDLPTFALGPMQIVSLSGKGVVRENSVSVAPSIKSASAATKKFPEGVYQICVQILAAGRTGGTLGTQCQTFSLVLPDAPTLISPDDHAVLKPPMFPIFTWTPVFVSPGVQATYNLTIAPMFQGQTPKEALDKSTPLLTQKCATASYFYEPSNPPFFLYPNAVGFAWQVEAFSLSPDGFLQSSYGKSEIYSFTLGSSAEPPVLVGPAENAVVSTKSPQFQWTYVFQASENTRFRLRVTEVLSGQTPEKAIENYPVLSQIIYGQVTTFKPTQPLSLSAAKNYVWQVQVLDAPTGTVLRSSLIRSFTISPLQLLVPSENAVVAMKRPPFSWSHQGGTGKFYDIRIAAIPMIMTPGFSLDNLMDKGPYLFQANGIDGSKSSITNTPGMEIPKYAPGNDLSFTIGQKYAWRITARQSAGGPIIGVSETRIFSYNPYQTGIPYNTQVSGKLVYRFPGPGENQFWPLGGTNIKLVVKYVLKNVSSAVNYAKGVQKGSTYVIPPASSLTSPGFKNNPADINKVLAVAKTDAQGNFTFSFISLDSMKLVAKNYQVSYGGGEFSGTVTGDLYRVARLIVEAPHSSLYTSPDFDIMVQPGETLAPGFFGLLAANVRSYTLKVHVKTFENIVQATTGPLGNMNVYLLRETRPALVPSNEGAEPKRSPGGNVETMKMYWGAVCEVIGKSQTGNDGIAHFTRLVKNIGPTDKYILYAESMPGSALNYKGWQGAVTYKHPEDYAVFNNEYLYKETAVDLSCFPVPIKVYGSVLRGDSKQPLLWAKVRLIETVFLATKELTAFSNLKGQFAFENLSYIQDAGKKNVIGPIRLLKVQRSGYRDTVLKVNNLAVMRPGDQWGKDIELRPYATIKGKIVDEFGNGASAYVTLVGGGMDTALAPPFIVMGTWKTAPASFELPSPSGWQKLIVDPTMFNSSYLRDTVSVYVGSATVELPQPIVLYRKAHRIRVTVEEATASKLNLPGSVSKKLAGATVRVEDKFGNPVQGPQGPLKGKTNQNGVIEFVFSNSGADFVLAVEGPEDLDHVARKMPLPPSLPSKSWKNVTVALKKAARISGLVMVGNNQPVQGARVFIGGSAAEFPVEAWTKNDGSFVLRNVPIGTNLFKAAKSKSNFIGDQKSLTVPAGGLQNVTFALKVYESMDISQLMGFPIEVDSLSEIAGSVRVNGRFVSLDSLANPLFRVPAGPTLAFMNLEIVPSSLTSVVFGTEVPVAKPKESIVKTEENTLPLQVYSSFPAVVQDQNIGVEVVESQSGLGAVKGKVFVPQNAFVKDIAFPEGGFYVRGSASADLRIPVVTASAKQPFDAPGGLVVVNGAGGSVAFTLFDFDATADSSVSRLLGDSLHLGTTIHTAIANITPSNLKIPLGNVTVTKNGVMSTISNIMKKASFKLDQWSVESDSISLPGYLLLNGGTLKTGAVDVPIISMMITPTSILAASFDLDNLSLGGIVPLKVHSQPLLGYDNANKRWFLVATAAPAASFSGLPGMAPGSKFLLSSFSLYSTESIMKFTPMVPQPTIKIYDIGILTPDLLSYFPSTGIIDIKGLSFSFPKVSVNAIVRYYKEDNQVKFRLVPFQFSFDSKGVHFASGFTSAEGATQVLDGKGFRAKGRISEAGKFDLAAWIYHTKDSTSLWVESPSTPYVANPPPWQSIPIAGNATYLDKIAGGMKPAGSQDWSNFWFAGDLVGSKAIGVVPGQNRLTFVVEGEVVATGQSLGVKNVDTPFGNMTWTFDFEQGRLWGNLHINKNIAGQIHLSGDANNVIDASGWYLFGGLTMTTSSPSFSGMAGILFGNYPMTSEIRTAFENYSWVYQNKGKLPPTFPNSVSGFYFEGSVAIPIPIFPDFDFDFGLISAKLTKQMGADLRFKAEFAETNTYGAGVDVFAKIEAGVGGTVGVACATVSASLLADLAFDGQYQSSGAWFLEGEQSITLKGSTKIGFGGCDSDCDGIDLGPLSTPCATESESGSKSIGVLCHYGSDGKYIHVIFK